MASPRRQYNIIQLVFFVSVAFLGDLTLTSDIDFQYPKGIIPCKTYEETRLDCHNRLLATIPPLEQNLTIINLSNNLLTEIRGKPFKQLGILQVLDMSNNKINSISSTAFSDLHNLEDLSLQNNMLASLPEDIFVHLTRLRNLDMSSNLFKILPPRLNWMTLHSLTSVLLGDKIKTVSSGSTSLEIGKGFQNLTNLIFLSVGISELDSNMTRSTFQYLTGLPIQILQIRWFHRKMGYIEHGIVLSLPNVQYLMIPYEALNSFKFSCPQLQTIFLLLDVDGTDSRIPVVDNSTFKRLAQWKSSLTKFRLFTTLVTKRTIRDFAFTWVPLIVVLDLKEIGVQFLSSNAFSGLNFLDQLILAHNYLNDVPSHTFHAFQSQSLRKLDLSLNGISTIASHAFSSVTSLKYLNLAGNPITEIGNWFDELSNLISFNMNGAVTSTLTVNLLHFSFYVWSKFYLSHISLTFALCFHI